MICKKVKVTIEMVVEDTDKLGWIPEAIYDCLNKGEAITSWDYEILEGNVQPIKEEEYYDE